MLVYRRKKLRGKYNPTTKRKQKPNLQKARVPEDINRKEYKEYAGQSVLMCSKCRKTMFKETK
jgi:hypothetical protein